MSHEIKQLKVKKNYFIIFINTFFLRVRYLVNFNLSYLMYKYNKETEA